MVTVELNKKVNDLFLNAEFVKEFRVTEDFEGMKKLFSNYGVEISDEDLDSFLEAAFSSTARPNGELTESEIENVAGGFVEWIIAGAAAGVIGGVCAYKIRKNYNTASGSCRR